MRVYLIPDEDSTYVSCVSDDAPSTDAIFLAGEGRYPVTAWHQRHDLNMCSLLMQEEIKNRGELLAYLDYLGKCRHKVLKLWDFSYDETDNKKLIDLFAKCHDRKAELMSEAMMEACEGLDYKYIDDSDFEFIDEPD